MTPYQLVREWMIKFGHELDVPMTTDLLKLCEDLIFEEADEVYAEIDDKDFSYDPRFVDKEKLTKELCDLIWVCYFCAAKFGLPIDEAFKRVYDSNMSKLGKDGKPVLREDGKILKGPNYKPVDLGDLFPKAPDIERGI